MQGRPGVNPLRFQTKLHVTAEELAALRKIAEETQIDAQQLLDIKEGFAVETPGAFRFGGHEFVESEAPGKETIPHPADLKRIDSGGKVAGGLCDGQHPFSRTRRAAKGCAGRISRDLRPRLH